MQVMQLLCTMRADVNAEGPVSAPWPRMPKGHTLHGVAPHEIVVPDILFNNVTYMHRDE